MCYFRITFLLIIFLNISSPVFAEIYKYQKDGVWHYSDTAPADQVENKSEMAESIESKSFLPNDDTPLLENYAAKNSIERATAATVTINSTLSFYGFGSGFFISDSGHILTGKNVVLRSPYTVCDHPGIKGPECVSRRLYDEKRRLLKSEKKLKHLKTRAQMEQDSKQKQFYEKKYQSKKKNYDKWRMLYEKQSRELESLRKKLEALAVTNKFKYRGKIVTVSSGADAYGDLRDLSKLSERYSITLIDGEELYVRFVAVSTKYDFALLKLDGYKTPKLTTGSSSFMARGNAVYAIGSTKHHKGAILLSSGKLSGITGPSIQTTIPINHFNSGGPLINLKGNVLGINIQKRGHNDIEGVGFVISIQTALEEFGGYLQ